MWWEIGAAANAVVMLAYFGISSVILRSLIVSGQFRENKLGAATGVIFFTCGVGHAIHLVHLMGPFVGIDADSAPANRAAFDWHQAGWDVVTAFVALFYWSLRRTYGPLMRGAKLFEDLKERQRQALEMNDRIIQGLVVARAALAYDQVDRSEEALDKTLAATRELVSDLLTETAGDKVQPGQLVRRDAAVIR